MTKQLLLDMELHDVFDDLSIRIVRVVGGWIYHTTEDRVTPALGPNDEPSWDSVLVTSVFVPEP